MDHAIAMATWPQRRLGEALFTLAEHAGISVSGSDRPQPPLDGDADALSSWIATAAGLGGFEARPVLVGLSDAATVAAHAPVLVRLRGLAGEPYLALIGKRGGKAIAIGPDGTRHRLGMAAIATLIRREFEAPIEAAVERNLDDMGMTAERRGRARAALLRERLAGVRFGGCWALRVSAGASVVAQARHAGVVPRLGLAVACHLLQYAMVLLAWWLLARGAFGSADPATWWGAGVLLAGLLPLRVLGTWVQGDAVVATGRILRRRLLHGALHVEPDEIRRRGEGVLFGTVLEAATVESVAIQNGLQTVFAALELTIAGGVLTFGASRPAIALLLVGWMAASCACAWRYAVRRREATRHRLHATNRLLESMLGHRTLKLHGEPERRTLDVARLLEEYAAAGDRMDGCGAWLSAVMPRGWLLIGVAAFAFEAPPTGPTVAAFAVTVAGVLLAFRACRRLATGLPGTIDAVIAWQCVASLTAAGPSTRRPATGCVNDPGSHATATVLEARDLTFRYPTSVVPVLQGCDLRVARGSNVLLEGPSGSGKTTLALVLAGLRQQESGAVLVDELDRSTVADWRWRRSVVMTPQIHDNHLISGSLAFNLLMGRRWPPTPTDFADALTVCRELGLEALLDRLPGGLNQTVGETGWQLSQGERARVFLGRALLQRPDLIVLDEAFSALDPETVDRVLQSVQRRTPTVLAIAHT